MEQRGQLNLDKDKQKWWATSGLRKPRATALSVYLAVTVLTLIGLGLMILALEIQTAVRAYVAAESQWSKSQKEAIYRLDRYTSTGDTTWLYQARESLEVPLEDLRARLAMEQQPLDREVAVDHFIAAGNHPDDAARMVWLFRYFSDAPYMRDAMDLWRESDSYIRRLQTIADETQDYFESGGMDVGGIAGLREELNQIADDVRPLQDGFSAALGAGSRAIDAWLKGAAAATIIALVFATALLFRWATRRIAESERQFRDTFEQAAMGMAQMQPDGRLVAANRALCELLGYAPSDMIGQSLSEFLQSAHDSERLGLLFSENETEKTRDFRLLTRNGAVKWCRLSLSHVDDTWNGQHHMILGVQDITETRDLMKELHYQARHDALTGTINRYEFEQQLTVALRQAQELGARHVLCFIDLDQFKVVNDTAGHLAGDEVLQEVTRLLRRELRRTDTLARLGGDEFGVILQDCDETVALEVADKLRQVIEGYVYRSEDTQLRLGASIGCVSIDENTQDPTELLRAADTACYMAKDYGRNRVVLYSLDDQALQTRHSDMAALTQIRTALTNDQFVLYAQEMHSLCGEQKPRCEVLVRMLDTDGELVPPCQFLPAAERYSIAPDIDRWVVQTSLETLARHPQHLAQLGACHINLSGQSIGREDFLEFLEQVLDQSPVDPAKLCFEITETAAISNLADARHFFERLSQRGCTFALDDFGSGLSSFGYLTSLPVDIIKIDGTFVLDVLNNEIHGAIIKSIGEIATLMCKSTVAECVETDEIRERMASLGIDWVQGYAVHYPCPLDKLLQEYAES